MNDAPLSRRILLALGCAVTAFAAFKMSIATALALHESVVALLRAGL